MQTEIVQISYRVEFQDLSTQTHTHTGSDIYTGRHDKEQQTLLHIHKRYASKHLALEEKLDPD